MWWVTVKSWNDLQDKLDSLTDAIHRQDFDQQPQLGIQPGPIPQTKTPLEGQPSPSDHSQSPPAPGDRNALDIHKAPDQEAASAGYLTPPPAGKTPVVQSQEMSEVAQAGQDMEWYG